VVKALAAGRIAPFYKVEDGTLPPEGDPERYKGATKDGDKWKAQWNLDGKSQHLGVFDTKLEAAKAYRTAIKGRAMVAALGVRYAPSFTTSSSGLKREFNRQYPYTAVDISRYLGNVYTMGQDGEKANPKVTAALDALYLLEVHAIKTSDIKNMNWAQLGNYVANQKRERERTILRTKKTRRQTWLTTLEPILCSNEFLKIGQNLAFEYQVFLWNFGMRIWNLYSTAKFGCGAPDAPDTFPGNPTYGAI
jgi:hypothetical protein